MLQWQEWYGALAKEIFNPNYARSLQRTNGCLPASCRTEETLLLEFQTSGTMALSPSKHQAFGSQGTFQLLGPREFEVVSAV